jgi:UDP-GlcNAc:undecaprenyl-phosphate GlcNAc-1-phosphate transferase
MAITTSEVSSKMLDQFTTILAASMSSMIEAFFISWIVLKTICYANENFLKFLYISSGKSTSNARLLGGLSLSASLFTAITSLLIFYPHTLNVLDKQIFSASLFSIFFVTLYGYIDDKFEVRVRFKLSLQLISILSFSYFIKDQISTVHPTAAFFVLSILGLTLINGTNLLDGLDTHSVKLGIAGSSGFLYLGVLANSAPTIYLSLIMISTLSMFYFFNREPAKVYMGEIGGSIIGLVYFIQACICLSQFQKQMTFENSGSLVLIACILPIAELGISFSRRIMKKKSPFRGDRFHLHYVLKNKYKLSASKTSNYIGMASVFISIFSFLTAYLIGPKTALAVSIVTSFSCYLWVCLDVWRTDIKQIHAENLFQIFEGKKVTILDSTKTSTFNISVKVDSDYVEKVKKSA